MHGPHYGRPLDGAAPAASDAPSAAPLGADGESEEEGDGDETGAAAETGKRHKHADVVVLRPDLRAEHLGDVKEVVVRVAVGGADGDGAVGAIATGAAIGEGEDIGGLEGRRRVAAVAILVAAQLGRVRSEELVEDPFEAVVLDFARVGDGDGLAIGTESELLSASASPLGAG